MPITGHMSQGMIAILGQSQSAPGTFGGKILYLQVSLRSRKVPIAPTSSAMETL